MLKRQHFQNFEVLHILVGNCCQFILSVSLPWILNRAYKEQDLFWPHGDKGIALFAINIDLFVIDHVVAIERDHSDTVTLDWVKIQQSGWVSCSPSLCQELVTELTKYFRPKVDPLCMYYVNGGPGPPGALLENYLKILPTVEDMQTRTKMIYYFALCFMFA